MNGSIPTTISATSSSSSTNNNSNDNNNRSDGYKYNNLTDAVGKIRVDAINKHHNQILKGLEKKYVAHIEKCLADFSNQYNKLQLSFNHTLNDVSDLVNDGNNNNNNTSQLCVNNMDENTKLNHVVNKFNSVLNNATSTVNSIQLPFEQSVCQNVNKHYYSKLHHIFISLFLTLLSVSLVNIIYIYLYLCRAIMVTQQN